MSSAALFGNNAVRSNNKNLVEFKAGKMILKGKMVYPDNRKGLLYVYQSEDSLMHFCWKDRTTGVVEDDLIIFPDDCEFKLVSQCTTGRVYQLKFKSSSRKLFFWLQDLRPENDEEYCQKVNEILNNPPTLGSQRSSGANPEGDLQNLLNNMSQQQLMQLFGGVGQIGGLGSLLGSMNRPFVGNRNSTTSSTNPITSAVRQSSTAPTTNTTVTAPGTLKPSDNDQLAVTAKVVESGVPATSGNNKKILLSDLQHFLSGIPSPGSDERGIINELSTAVPAAFTAGEYCINTIEAYLPPGDNLSTTLSSPQFHQALSMFWTALQSGQAAAIMQQFRVSSEAIKAAQIGSIEQFVSALDSNEETSKTRADKEDKKNSDDKIESQQESPSDKSSKKNFNGKDDNDDEGMALD